MYYVPDAGKMVCKWIMFLGLCFQVSELSWDTQEQHLLEMFPKCSVIEARSALSIAKGDMEEAVRLIIEGDVQLKCPSFLNVSSFVAPFTKLVLFHKT